MHKRFLIFALPLAMILALTAVHAGGDKDKKTQDKEEKKPKKPASDSYLLIVATPGGKEGKVVDWRFTQGTRKFAPYADEKVNPKTKSGPEYLEFREEKSTKYSNGIFTLVPLTSIKTITYDRDKKTVDVVAVGDGPDDIKLNGSTKFKGSNKITIEAEQPIDGLGNATVKFQGGIEKGVQSITFPTPKPVEKAKGAPGVVTADDMEKSKHAAIDVQPLYLVDGNYRVLPYLMFKKTVKIEMDKIAGLRFLPPEGKAKASNDYEVMLKDGNKHTLTLLTSIEGDKKKALTLVGLVGRVPAGYKLFSLDAIFEYRAGGGDEKKVEEEKK